MLTEILDTVKKEEKNQDDLELLGHWQTAVAWNRDYRAFIKDVLGQKAYDILKSGRGAYLAGFLDIDKLRNKIAVTMAADCGPDQDRPSKKPQEEPWDR